MFAEKPTHTHKNDIECNEGQWLCATKAHKTALYNEFFPRCIAFFYDSPPQIAQFWLHIRFALDRIKRYGIPKRRILMQKALKP